MSNKKITDLDDPKSTRFMEYGRKVSAMAARYRRDISVVIVEIKETELVQNTTLETLQAAGNKTMRECDYIAGYGDRGIIFILPETPSSGAQAFAGRLQTAISEELPAVMVGIAGWSPSAVAPGILSLVASAAEALQAAYEGKGPKQGLGIRQT